MTALGQIELARPCPSQRSVNDHKIVDGLGLRVLIAASRQGVNIWSAREVLIERGFGVGRGRNPCCRTLRATSSENSGKGLQTIDGSFIRRAKRKPYCALWLYSM